MAFNNFLAPVWLAPGGTHYWWYTFGGNRGAQYATADVKTPGSQMMATQQGEKMEDDGSITYYVNITNNGPRWAFYNLHGGGLT